MLVYDLSHHFLLAFGSGGRHAMATLTLWLAPPHFKCGLGRQENDRATRRCTVIWSSCSSHAMLVCELSEHFPLAFRSGGGRTQWLRWPSGILPRTREKRPCAPPFFCSLKIQESTCVPYTRSLNELIQISRFAQPECVANLHLQDFTISRF